MFFMMKKNCEQWKLFFPALSLDDGMVVTPVTCAAGYSSRDVPEERCLRLVYLDKFDIYLWDSINISIYQDDNFMIGYYWLSSFLS